MFKYFLSLAFCMLFYSPIAEGAEYEKVLERTRYLEENVKDLLLLYNDILYCDREECLAKIKKERISPRSWSNMNFGTMNAITDVEIGLLDLIISDIKHLLEKDPGNASLKEKLESYEDKLQRLRDAPYHE